MKCQSNTDFLGYAGFPAQYVVSALPKTGSASSDMEIDAAFGRGLLIGQIAVHCEHVVSGGKLAAQIGCQKECIETAIQAIISGGCSYMVEEGGSSDRVAVWIYKHSIAAMLIEELRNKTAPSAVDVVITGKLFGYSDHEIESYITGQASLATARATSGLESMPHCDSDKRG